MVFTPPTEDIIVQDGTFAFDYDASGTVYGGQGVYAVGTMQAQAPNGAAADAKRAGCIGVCAYNQTDGNPIAVYGPGNIVRVRVSGTSVAVGDNLQLTYDGMFTDTAICCSGVSAIALETKSTTNSECRVMLR